ncbi:MAG: ROK family protein [Clostridia bacterium]|nr:ROK family protein [Clostridia bacterium]MBQ4574614.1 ROK family protein [Clostridia bacterium]
MYYIGIDIGGTKCAASLGSVENDAPTLISKTQIPTDRAPYDMLTALMDEAEKLLTSASLAWEDIASIGISCGGPLDSKRGVILSPPNLPTWDHIEAVDYIKSRTGRPTALQNDANACAVAEWKFGAGRGHDSMIFLTFGTGFGAGLILDGKLYSGHRDNAGEVGHVRLAEDGPVGYYKAGSVEGFCSGGGIAQLGRRAIEAELANGNTPKLLEAAGSMEAVNAKLIAELAREGDPLCLSVYNECADRLGMALSMLMDIVDPEVIVIGSIFARSEDLLRTRMQAVIDREALMPCPVVAAGLGEKIGDYAALSVAYACVK